MKIIRKLKTAEWSWDEETSELKLLIWIPNTGDQPEYGDVVPEDIKLNRVQAFSLARFLIRTFQRMSMKKRKGGRKS